MYMNARKPLFFIALTLASLFSVPVRVDAQKLQDRRDRHDRYKLVDLGTFGGPESYINPAFTFGSHNQVNRRGTVVGGAGTAIPLTPTSNPFICGGLDGIVPFVNHALSWQRGETTDLGALPDGDNCSVATAINSRGEITGTSENGIFDTVLGLTELRAVIWKDGTIKDLGTLGGNYSTGGGINQSGQVVGAALNAVPDPFSYLEFGLARSPDGTQTRAFLWEDGVMHDLGTLGGPDAVALFINELGQVAGFSYTNSIPNPPVPPLQPGLPTIHAFTWTRKGGMRDLGSLGGTVGYVNCECGGFNNHGQFVGVSSLPGDQETHPFLWDGDKLIDLFTDSIGGNPLMVSDINDAGEVVGGATFPNRPFDAFLWKNGIATDLGSVDGDGCSSARAINSRGQVVGQSFTCDGSTLHSFLWENGSIVDLSKLIPRDSNVELVDPLSINDRGEIAGIGLPPGCTLAIGDTTCGHAFVLIPCERDGLDEVGCDDTEELSADAMHNISVPVGPSSLAKPIEGSLTPRAIAARMLARFSWNRGLGAPTRK
jgi:probable HAF family extracellular repeat protein